MFQERAGERKDQPVTILKNTIAPHHQQVKSTTTPHHHQVTWTTSKQKQKPNQTKPNHE